MKAVLLVCLLACAIGLKTQAPYMTNPDRGLIMAHRGDCGQFPEHTK